MSAPPSQIVPPSTARARGINRLWHPGVWGTIVGAVGATTFVLVNRVVLPAPWPVAALIVWVLAMAVYVVCIFVLPRSFVDIQRGDVGSGARVGAGAGLVYVASVVGMVLLMRFGTMILGGAGLVELQPALIVVAVGLHFIPFAAAFHTPMFLTLGILMTVVGLTGLAIGWQWDGRAASGVAVIAGVLMLIVMAVDAWRGTRSAPPQRS